MTEFFLTVQEQRRKLAEEKKDKTVEYYYFQKGAGMHYREICYLSGRVEREELSDWSVNKCNTSIVLNSIRVSNNSDNLFILYKSLMAKVNVCKE